MKLMSICAGRMQPGVNEWLLCSVVSGMPDGEIDVMSAEKLLLIYRNLCVTDDLRYQCIRRELIS